jgi:hypothetical protein
MQKISTYLYPNRIELLADLAGINVEYTNVYQRNVKIYKGVDNVIEFDIKNADQKRLDLTGTPAITDIMLTVMDAQGNALPNSPYTVEPSITVKGIATVTIPSADLADLGHQFLNYTVTAMKETANIPLYADSRFGVVGKMEIVGNAMPTIKPTQVYTTSTGEIDLNGRVISRSPAIPTTFYEAVPTTEMNVHAFIEDFIGTIYIQGAKSGTISVESFKNAPKIMEFTYTEATTTTVHFHPLTVGDYQYFRVSWENSDQHRVSPTNPDGLAGKVVKITADIGPGEEC